MANWIARLILAMTLIFTSGSVILFSLLGSLAVLLTSGLIEASAAHAVPAPSSPARPLDELSP
jgi:hypothetical protein